MRRFVFILTLAIFGFSCSNDPNDIAPVEERVAEAKAELIDKLTAPANGWRLDYRPVSGSGTFLILLDFDEKGTVRIQSDVNADSGAYFDQTIPYRVDNSFYMELIFETYGVFHYLFEQDQALFGAEFEFLFVEETNGNLVLASKSDLGERSMIELVPAPSDASSLFSREEVAALESLEARGPVYFFGLPRVFPIHQLYFSDADITMYWEIDQLKRILYVDQVVAGNDPAAVLRVDISEAIGYTFLNGALVPSSPIAFSLEGVSYFFDAFHFDFLSETGGSAFCPTDLTELSSYSGTVNDVGSFTLTQTLASGRGKEFTSGPNAIYSVNIPFIFDQDINSLADEGGSIATKLPNAQAFIMTFGFESDSIPAYSVGFIVRDETGLRQYYLAEFDPVALAVNRLEINFNGSYYLSGTPPVEAEGDLGLIMNEIFEGGTVYIYYTPFDGVPLFRLYNPCNHYEVFLVG